MRIILFLAAFLISQSCFAQTMYRGAVSGAATVQNYNMQAQEQGQRENTKFKYSERSENMREDLRNMRGTIGSSQDAITARNLLLLKEVLDFKIQDEKLASEIKRLKENREFNKDLLKALNQLDNKKIRTQKDNEVINILNDAGSRIYNSLVN